MVSYCNGYRNNRRICFLNLFSLAFWKLVGKGFKDK